MSCRNKAFTLMELMVVVAIIALLVGIVIVSMRGVRASATRSESLGALRQMALAHGQYTDDHRGRLMPGYIDASLFAPGEEFENLRVKLPAGDVLAPEDSQSYVWRLAPYLDDAWLTLFADTTEGPRSVFAAEHGDPVSPIHGPAGSSAYAGGLSERPSYGMNSIFVGGDSWHGGSDISGRHPWQDSQDKIAATRLSQVKNPARLIVFGPTALANAGNCPAVYEDSEVGFCELRPPYLVLADDSAPWTLDQWTVGIGGRVVQTNAGEYGDGAGLPIARSGQGLMPVAHLDGSAVVAEISTLSRDMRHWSPFEVGLRATVDPTLRCP
ncbi:MAG: type IV pilin protein [Planctomycetota bacterium]|jgi:prepilin-type N-terminal cleavage/methylation domain-containing protein